MRVENVRSLLPSFYFISCTFFSSPVAYIQIQARPDRQTGRQADRADREHTRMKERALLKKKKKNKKSYNQSLTRYKHRLTGALFKIKQWQAMAGRESEREREHTREITFPPSSSHHNVTRTYVRTHKYGANTYVDRFDGGGAGGV